MGRNADRCRSSVSLYAITSKKKHELKSLWARPSPPGLAAVSAPRIASRRRSIPCRPCAVRRTMWSRRAQNMKQDSIGRSRLDRRVLRDLRRNTEQADNPIANGDYQAALERAGARTAAVEKIDEPARPTARSCFGQSRLK